MTFILSPPITHVLHIPSLRLPVFLLLFWYLTAIFQPISEANTVFQIFDSHFEKSASPEFHWNSNISTSNVIFDICRTQKIEFWLRSLLTMSVLKITVKTRLSWIRNRVKLHKSVKPELALIQIIFCTQLVFKTPLPIHRRKWRKTATFLSIY